MDDIVFAVNKMDLVDWSEERFREIRDEIEDFLPKLDTFSDVKFLPLSALDGGNVVDPSEYTSWYEGPTLMGHLESVHIASDWNLNAFRFPVQWVNRPNNPTEKTLHDFRGFSGQIAGGIVKVGQEVLVLPSGRKSFVKEIHTFDGNLDEAFSPQSVTLVLEDDLDISRGDMIVGTDSLPGHSSDISVRVCWMEQRPLQAGQKYFLKHGTQTVQAKVISLDSRINIQTYEPEPHPAELAMNDIGEVRLRTANPLVFDAYTTNRLTGSIVLVEPSTNATAAAGMLRGPEKVYQPEYDDFMI